MLGHHLYGRHFSLHKGQENIGGKHKKGSTAVIGERPYLKPKKCEFKKTKIEWLGMIIEKGKISMDAGKLKGIRDWPVPTTVKQVRGFLGFGNFYQIFIRHVSEIAKPLNELLKKDRTFEWTQECQRSFDKLKKRFTEEPILAMPDHTKSNVTLPNMQLVRS